MALRTSLLIGLIATLVAVFIGIVFGAFSGYYGGRLDDFLMRITEIFQTIPSYFCNSACGNHEAVNRKHSHAPLP